MSHITSLFSSVSSCPKLSVYVLSLMREKKIRTYTKQQTGTMLCSVIFTLKTAEEETVIDGVVAGIFRILSADNFLVKEMVIC